MTRGKSEKFEEVLATHVRDSDFYKRIRNAYNILEQVRAKSDGHGITLVLKLDEEPSIVDRWMQNSKPYNGMPHNMKDADIADVMADPKKRGKDFATVVNSLDTIVGANVPLPMDVECYQDKYGIDAPIWAFLGYSAQEEAPGGRMNSALCATDKAGSKIFILTLGENKLDGSKGTINGYFCGDRIYSETGRKMNWDIADRRPDCYGNVIPLFESKPGENHCCGGAYRPDKVRAAAGPI
jgi:hypothetical protein